MFSILYLEISELGSNKYSFLYYMLDFSGNYIGSTEREKEYGEESNISMNDMLNKLAELINSLGSEASNIDILTDIGYEHLVNKILKRVEAYLYVNTGTPLVARGLGQVMGFSWVSLFDIYTMNFGVPESRNKIDMIDRVVTYYVVRDCGNGTFLIMHLAKRYGCYILTSCWMTVNVNLKVSILGRKSSYFDLSEDNYIPLNIYFTELKLALADSGLSLDSVRVLFYSEMMRKQFENWARRHGLYNKDASFIKPILIWESLSQLIKPKLRELIGDSQNMFMRIFSSITKMDYSLSAYDLARILVNLYPQMNFQVSGSRLISDKMFCKDFSSDIPVDIDLKKGFRFGIIMDCEGNPYGGCSEVGGIIFAYAQHMLVKLETFSFKNRDFVEGVQSIITAYTEKTGRYLPSRGIPILTYGGSDAGMIERELQESSSRQLRRKIEKSFQFVDCQGYVFDFLVENKIELDNKKLSTVANFFGVEIVRPVHSGLNDAKTLFNVLSRIYLSKNDFVSGM